MSRTVLLIGATGLVGHELLSQLLAADDVAHVNVVARRNTGLRHPKLSEHVAKMQELEKHARAFAVDQVYCALGTTMKTAGSREAFRFVDHDLPLAAARLGLAGGARHYLLVSALGANARSRVFYNRVKGEIEEAVISLGYRSVTIARPSLLLGPRAEYRRGERIAAKLGWLMPPSMKPIDARDVAKALVEAGREDAAGVRVLESRMMRRRWAEWRVENRASGS